MGCERGCVAGKAVLGTPVPVPVLWVQLFVFSLYCSSRSGGRRLHVGTGMCCTWDLPVFQCMMEMLGRLVCSGAAADVFCCQISVTSKEQQGWRDLKLSNLTSCSKAGSELSKLSQQMFVLSDGLSSSSLGDPWKSFIVLAITKIFLVSDSDFCAAVENCCPLALLLLYRVSCSVLWRSLWESGPCLPWPAGPKTCLGCCVWYLPVLSQQTPFCDSHVDFWGMMGAF